jgi:hypothetical protein
LFFSLVGLLSLTASPTFVGLNNINDVWAAVVAQNFLFPPQHSKLLISLHQVRMKILVNTH